MVIKTIGQLKKIINQLDDDFKIEISIVSKVPEEQLKNLAYPYPYIHKEARLEFHDIGVSDKEACFGVRAKEDENE